MSLNQRTMKKIILPSILSLFLSPFLFVTASDLQTEARVVSFANLKLNLRRRSTALIGDGNYDRFADAVEDGDEGEVCGYSVDISNDGRSLLVGCPHTTVFGETDAGSVALYRLISDEEGIGVDRWLKVGSISGTTKDGHAGMSVSMARDADIIAFGEPFFSNGVVNLGRVRLYRIGGTYIKPIFSQIGRSLIGESENDRFGIDISLSGDGTSIVIGADQKDRGAGFVDVYNFLGGDWVLQRRIKGIPTSLERFGIAVSISRAGDRVGIGANEGDGDDGSNKAGRAVVYNVADGLKAFEIKGTKSERLGRSVAISDDGETFAMGSILSNCQSGLPNCGRVQVMDLVSGAKVGNGNDVIVGDAANARCGRSVDISNFSSNTGTVVTGCAGKVLIGTFDGTSFSIQSVTSKNGNSVSDFFGSSVAISKVRQALAVGAPGPKDAGLANSIKGSVQTFGNAVGGTRSPSTSPSSAPSISRPPSAAPSTSESPTFSHISSMPSSRPTRAPVKPPTKPVPVPPKKPVPVPPKKPTSPLKGKGKGGGSMKSQKSQKSMKSMKSQKSQKSIKSKKGKGHGSFYSSTSKKASYKKGKGKRKL